MQGGMALPTMMKMAEIRVILSRTPLRRRSRYATLAQSIYFLFSRPLRPSGESYSFQKIYAFPLLKHEKQEIFRSPAKGGQMNPMNDHAQDPARLPKPRRDYKDTLFRLLFRDRNRLLSLYNAVNGTSYNSPEDLTVVTLENAVYMNMKNDAAFLVDFQLNLYEHQSTWNPNMPLRNLFYAAKEYQTLTRDESLYAPQLVKIPTPNFVVFYNGDKEIGDSCVLKISDSFEHPTEDPGLELKVKVLKIAPGKNKELLDTCQTLKEYMLFVERVRLHAKTMTVGAAVHRAVTECIREGILSDFLSQNRAEVIAVSIFEYDEERELALMRKAIASEARKEGHDAGHKEGREDEIKSLIRTKLQKGKSIPQIADELERDEMTIKALIQGMGDEAE